MFSVACVGDISVDDYICRGHRCVGGISFNVAWNLRSMGIAAEVVSAVGNDPDSDAILASISKNSFSTEAIARLVGATACQKIVVSESGERNFVGYTSGVLAEVFENPVLDECFLNRFDLVHVPLTDGMELLFERISRANLRGLKAADFSVDASVENGLQSSMLKYAPFFDLVFIGGTPELEPFVQGLAMKNPEKIFVLTLGHLGSSCFKGHLIFRQEVIPIERVVDTTGCGDAFQAAFIAHWLSDRVALSGALLAGAVRASHVAGRIGATECLLSGRVSVP